MQSQAKLIEEKPTEEKSTKYTMSWEDYQKTALPTLSKLYPSLDFKSEEITFLPGDDQVKIVTFTLGSLKNIPIKVSHQNGLINPQKTNILLGQMAALLLVHKNKDVKGRVVYKDINATQPAVVISEKESYFHFTVNFFDPVTGKILTHTDCNNCKKTGEVICKIDLDNCCGITSQGEPVFAGAQIVTQLEYEIGRLEREFRKSIERGPFNEKQGPLNSMVALASKNERDLIQSIGRLNSSSYVVSPTPWKECKELICDALINIFSSYGLTLKREQITDSDLGVYYEEIKIKTLKITHEALGVINISFPYHDNDIIYQPDAVAMLAKTEGFLYLWVNSKDLQKVQNTKDRATKLFLYPNRRCESEFPVLLKLSDKPLTDPYWGIPVQWVGSLNLDEICEPDPETGKFLFEGKSLQPQLEQMANSLLIRYMNNINRAFEVGDLYLKSVSNKDEIKPIDLLNIKKRNDALLVKEKDKVYIFGDKIGENKGWTYTEAHADLGSLFKDDKVSRIHGEDERLLPFIDQLAQGHAPFRGLKEREKLLSEIDKAKLHNLSECVGKLSFSSSIGKGGSVSDYVIPQNRSGLSNHVDSSGSSVSPDCSDHAVPSEQKDGNTVGSTSSVSDHTAVDPSPHSSSGSKSPSSIAPHVTLFPLNVVEQNGDLEQSTPVNTTTPRGTTLSA